MQWISNYNVFINFVCLKMKRVEYNIWLDAFRVLDYRILCLVGGIRNLNFKNMCLV